MGDEIYELYPSTRLVDTKKGYTDNKKYFLSTPFFKTTRKEMFALSGWSFFIFIYRCNRCNWILHCEGHRIFIDIKGRRIFTGQCETMISWMVFANLQRSYCLEKRDLIVDAFAFCGLFPLNTSRNTHRIQQEPLIPEWNKGTCRTDTVGEASDRVPENLSSILELDVVPSTSLSLRKAFESPKKSDNSIQCNLCCRLQCDTSITKGKSKRELI